MYGQYLSPGGCSPDPNAPLDFHLFCRLIRFQASVARPVERCRSNNVANDFNPGILQGSFVSAEMPNELVKSYHGQPHYDSYWVAL
jgi:flagellar biosynthesis/type III secretory pathway chaperone